MPFRPGESPSSIASRQGAQALAEGLRPGCDSGAAVLPTGSAPKSVITSLAGFAGTRSLLTSVAGFSGTGSVITSLAGFAAGCRPQLPGGRNAIPAAFKYAAAVSRWTPVTRWIRRSDHPKRPKVNVLALRF